ncbi:hypothetical protein N7495_004175 [Penicillium taxi]|uniref:uncharacterized protein n=1 Tax=Penicillium taxi TaxID=168475 RepID=UPI0025451CB3|nr:uncharacterized protein N7495_004175 [Penicillium taxi]KAJ5899431.1 hypothetical protein N7495_004175 [Penicillium taxi]
MEITKFPMKAKQGNLCDLFDSLEIEKSSTPIRKSCHRAQTMNITKSLRKYMDSSMQGKGTVRASSLRGRHTNFTIAMDDAYAYKIGMEDFDPDEAFSEIMILSNQLSEHLQSQLSPQEEASLEDKILNSLARMVYGSNMIERAGSEQGITLKLCMPIFQGKEVPKDIGETSEEFMALKKELLRKDVLANTSAVLRSQHEIL